MAWASEPVCDARVEVSADAYLWAEVLEADGFDTFVEAGDPFDPAIAERLRRFIYAAGDSIAPDEAFRAFRGRAPKVDAMLRQRGLLAVSEP